jgi:hypothetical protein
LGDASPPVHVVQEFDEQLFLASVEEPPTLEAAEADVRWWHTMEEDMGSIKENKKWELVDPPIGCKPIGLKWVFKLKKNERGEVVKHRARLVAEGFVQREGIYFEEVFAAVARMDSVCLLLALAATKDWSLSQRGACRGGQCATVARIHRHQRRAKVLRLRKALYGLR